MSAGVVRARAVVGHVPPRAEADDRRVVRVFDRRADPGVVSDHGQAGDRAVGAEQRAVVELVVVEPPIRLAVGQAGVEAEGLQRAASAARRRCAPSSGCLPVADGICSPAAAAPVSASATSRPRRLQARSVSFGSSLLVDPGDATARGRGRLVRHVRAVGSAMRGAVPSRRETEPSSERAREMALVDEPGVDRDAVQRRLGLREHGLPPNRVAAAGRSRRGSRRIWRGRLGPHARDGCRPLRRARTPRAGRGTAQQGARAPARARALPAKRSARARPRRSVRARGPRPPAT